MSDITVDGTPYVIGKKYLIRTVTMYWAGVLECVYTNEITLKPGTAAFIGWMGTIHDLEKNGSVKHHEKVDGRVIINRQAIVDVIEVSNIPSD